MIKPLIHILNGENGTIRINEILNGDKYASVSEIEKMEDDIYKIKEEDPKKGVRFTYINNKTGKILLHIRSCN